MEFMDSAPRQALQIERLRNTVKLVYEKVPFYREKMEAAGVKPEDLKTLADIMLLPFTVKDDLRQTYPYGLFAVPLEEIVEIHASSGTTGKQIVVGSTRDDLAVWQEVMARTLAAGGVHQGDFLQNAYGYGLFTGGLGFHYGAGRIGASVIPISGGQTARQIQLMQDFGTTVLCCTPSYALVIAEAAKEMGLTPSQLRLRVAFCGAEPWSETMRQELQNALQIDALDLYGLTEIIGPGVSFECLEKNGMHINEDHFYPEVINPQTGKPVADGEIGEIVFTTITKQGIPILRYRTRDLTCLMPGICPCGRTLRRMKRVGGRSDDMLIIRGVNVFPSQIEEVLIRVEGTTPNYLLVVDRQHHRMDELEVQVEVSPEIFSDEIARLETLEKRIKKEIESALGLSVAVKLVEPKSLERSMGKAKRVIDRRDLGK
jgi:phenylacetate-CoA ligase